MHNRSYNEQDAIQRLLLFEEGLSRLIELMKIEKKDVLGNDMDFLCQSIMQDVCRKDIKKRLEKLLRYWSRLTSVLG